MKLRLWWFRIYIKRFLYVNIIYKQTHQPDRKLVIIKLFYKRNSLNNLPKTAFCPYHTASRRPTESHIQVHSSFPLSEFLVTKLCYLPQSLRSKSTVTVKMCLSSQLDSLSLPFIYPSTQPPIHSFNHLPINQLSICYGLNICVPPKFICWNPNP